MSGDDGLDRSWASSAASRASMRANRSVDTKPELALRSALHRRGLRFFKNYRIVTPDRAIRADIVFTRMRIAVFVDGCFWHLCPDHGHFPGGVNAGYWKTKLSRNAERDLESTELLRRDEWTVVRVWEHESVEDAAGRIEGVINAWRREHVATGSRSGPGCYPLDTNVPTVAQDATRKGP